MTSDKIRESFLEFFKKRGHKIVPSSSLIPDDPSVLLTTAGMQQFKRYYTGELDPIKDFGSRNTASIQKSFRTSDIDEVGDESHLTFFEMLGNFSFGGYFKEEAIEYGRQFIEDVMDLKIDYVTVFDPAKVPAGDWRKGVPRDDESRAIWEKLGVKDIRAEGTDVFWGPTGNEGPCGPTTEIYVNGMEIWNIVFNEFYCDKNKKLTPLKTPGVDTGMGLERLAMVSQKAPTIFETDLFTPLMTLIPINLDESIKRVMVDHARAVTFLLADGVRPSNKEAGYVLRRLMRRAMIYQKIRHLEEKTLDQIVRKTVDFYGSFYKELRSESEKIYLALIEEERKFSKTLEEGLRALRKYLMTEGKKYVGPPTAGKELLYSELAKSAFNLYQSYGLPFEAFMDVLENDGVYVSRADFRKIFDEEFAKHQEISRAGREKKFGGHGLILDTGELKAGSEEELRKVTRLHTATHLLNQALREVLGPEVEQRGSDITAERTRFDFTFPRKMTAEEIKKVEKIVNEKIKEDLPVGFREMPKEEAMKTGALHFFRAKYPDRVKVYYIGKSLEEAWSKEFCGGPHVAHTAEIGRVRITKEEAVAAGVRRIRATLE